GIAVAPLYVDIELAPDGTVDLPVPAGHTAFAYVYEGDAKVGGALLPAHNLGVLGEGDTVAIAAGPAGARAILVAGKPLSEPVARYGPFVMNTREEIIQAVHDFEAGRF